MALPRVGNTCLCTSTCSLSSSSAPGTCQDPGQPGEAGQGPGQPGKWSQTPPFTDQMGRQQAAGRGGKEGAVYQGWQV